MNRVKIVYLCDREQCDHCLGKQIENGEITSLEIDSVCVLTTDKNHARYKDDDFRVFEKVFDRQRRTMYLVEMNKKDFAAMCNGEIHGI